MNNLQKIRKEIGISATELCAKLGISRQLLWYNENNKLSLSLALKVSDLLKVNVFEILGDDVFLIKPLTNEDKKIVIENIQK